MNNSQEHVFDFSKPPEVKRSIFKELNSCLLNGLLHLGYLALFLIFLGNALFCVGFEFNELFNPKASEVQNLR